MQSLGVRKGLHRGPTYRSQPLRSEPADLPRILDSTSQAELRRSKLAGLVGHSLRDRFQRRGRFGFLEDHVAGVRREVPYASTTPFGMDLWNINGNIVSGFLRPVLESDPPLERPEKVTRHRIASICESILCAMRRAPNHDEIGEILATILSSCTPSERKRVRHWFALEDRYPFVRIGPFYFFEPRTLQSLNPLLLNFFGSDLIRVPGLPNSTLGKPGRLKYFTAATIGGLLGADLRDAFVIDAGSGDGFLSIAALKAGAREVVLIDNMPGTLRRAVMNLRAAGYRRGADFQIITGDLLNPEDLVRRMPVSENRQRPLWLLSDIGDWPNNYGACSNRVSLAFAGLYAQRTGLTLTGAVMGGYETGRSGHGHRADLQLAKSMGLSFLACHTEVETSYSLTLQRSQ